MTEQTVAPLQLVVVATSDIEQDTSQAVEIFFPASPVDNRIEAEPAIPHLLHQFAAIKGNRKVHVEGRII